MNICKDYEALLDLYVDGELTAEDMMKVRDHLDTCPTCQSYVDDALTIRAAFPEAEETELPEGFHESVMTRISQTAVPKKKRRAWMGLAPVAAACLALAVAVQGGLPGMDAKQEAATAQYAYSALPQAPPLPQPPWRRRTLRPPRRTASWSTPRIKRNRRQPSPTS